jgi:hypothetical protein
MSQGITNVGFEINTASSANEGNLKHQDRPSALLPLLGNAGSPNFSNEIVLEGGFDRAEGAGVENEFPNKQTYSEIDGNVCKYATLLVSINFCFIIIWAFLER